MNAWRNVPSTLVALLVALLLGTALAHAVTEQELASTADALLADYEALETRIDACPDGTCSEAQQLADELDALGLELDQLHADRAILGGCGCQQLDATIADIDALDGTLNVIVDGWEDVT